MPSSSAADVAVRGNDNGDSPNASPWKPAKRPSGEVTGVPRRIRTSSLPRRGRARWPSKSVRDVAATSNGNSPSSFSSSLTKRVRGLPIASSADVPSFSARPDEMDTMARSSFAAHSSGAAPISICCSCGTRRSQPRCGRGSIDPSFEDQRNLFAFRALRGPTARRHDQRPPQSHSGRWARRAFARAGRSAVICGSASCEPTCEPASDLQRDELRIGGDQPVLTVQPAADRAAIRGRGRHSRLPKSSVPRDSRDRAEATR